MATKKTGISRDLIIHPGETISDILEARNITQAELAARTGVSPAFVGKVIAGKKDISGKFAMALEYALGIPKSFWLNLQAGYDAELLEINEEYSICDEELNICKEINELVKYLRNRNLIPDGEKKNELIISLRKFFKVSCLSNLARIPSVSAFRIDSQSTVNPYILGAWIRMCQANESNLNESEPFNPEKIDELISELKGIMISDEPDLQEQIKATLTEYGIDFEIVRHFRGAPVQGFLYKRSDNRIKICMTIRKSFADIFWFSLFHEIGHLVNGDLSRTSQFIDLGNEPEKEESADRFASERLINSDDYQRFLADYEKDKSIRTIERFSLDQKVKSFIVIGRMQKEGIIKYNQYSSYKIRYKWAE
ncbi:MAG: HigA family addiction module antitoxin [Oscillospiraceae bacterium]